MWDLASEKPKKKGTPCNVKGSRLRARRRFKRFLKFSLIAIGLIAISLYVFRKPIQAEMRSRLEAQLTKEGIHATYELRDFNLLNGLMLRDLVIFDTEEKTKPVLSLSNLSVRYNIIGILLNTTAVDIQLKDADLSVWEGGESYTINGIRADIQAGRSGVDVDQLIVKYGDLDLNLQAKVEWETAEAERKRRKERKRKEAQSEEGTEEPEKKKPRKKGVDVEGLVEALKQIPDTENGQIRVDIDYDFTDYAAAPTIEGLITANVLEWKGIRFEELLFELNSATGRTGNPIIEITQGRFNMGDGSLVIHGDYDPADRKLIIRQFNSDIDPVPLFAAIEAEKPEDKRKPVPPIPPHRVSAKGILDLKNPFLGDLSGSFETLAPYEIKSEKSETPSFTANRIKTAYQLGGSKLELSHLDAEIDSGSVPTSVGKGGATVHFGEDKKPVSIDLNGILVERDGGTLAIVGSYSVVEKSIELKKLSSDLDFVSLLKDLGLDDPFKGKVSFETPPEISASGTLPFEELLSGDLKASIKLAGKTTLESAGNSSPPLAFKDTLIPNVRIRDQKLMVKNLTTRVGDDSMPTTIDATTQLQFVTKEPLLPSDKPKPQITNITFGPVTARRGEGDLFLEGSFDPEAKSLVIQKLESQLDIMALLAEFGMPNPIEGKVSFPVSPTLTLMGEIPFDNPDAVQLKGSLGAEEGLEIPIGEDRSKVFTLKRIEIPEFVYRGQQLKIPNVAATAGPEETPLILQASVFADFDLTKQISINDFSLSQQDRRLNVDLAIPIPATQIAVSKLQSNLDILAALRDFGIGDPTGGKVVFKEPPLISADGVVNLEDLNNSKVDWALDIPAGFSVAVGEAKTINVRDFKAGRCEFSQNGILTHGTMATLGTPEIPIKLDSDLGIQFHPDKAPSLGFRRLVLTRGDRTLSFAGALPLSTNTLVVTRLDSSVNPFQVLQEIGMGDPTGGKVQFNAPPTIAAEGQIALNDFFNTSDLKGSIQAPSGLKVQLDEARIIDVQTFETTFGIGGGGISTPKLVAQAFGGTIQANTILRPQLSPFGFDAVTRLTDIRLQDITSFFGAGEKRTGLISGEFRGGGNATLGGVTGAGSVNMHEAYLTDVPIYKGLRPLLLAINLGEWKSEDGNEISSDFAIKDGIIASDNIKLVGDFYEVKSKLNLDLNERTIVADGAVATTGATRVVTEIVGKILEVEASGSLDDLKWRLKNAPGVGSLKDLGNLSTDLVKNTLATAAKPGKLIQDAGSAVTDTIGNTASGIGKTIKGIGGIGRKIKEEMGQRTDVPAEVAPPTVPPQQPQSDPEAAPIPTPNQ